MAGQGGVEGRKERESEREAGGQERSEGAKRAGGQEQGSARWPPLLPGMDRRMVHGQSEPANKWIPNPARQKSLKDFFCFDSETDALSACDC